MATNSKEVQRRADSKRAGKRARCWQCIVYQESAVEGWLKILKSYGIEFFVSPLHDMDLRDDGEVKKSHYHVLVSFKNPMRYVDATEIFDAIGGVYPNPESAWNEFIRECKVRDMQLALRYHCHLGQPDKAQYNPENEITFSAADYIDMVMTKADYDAQLDDVFDFMDTYAIRTYPQLTRMVKIMHPEWKRIVYHKCVRQVVEYAKGINFEISKGIGTNIPQFEEGGEGDA